MPDENIKRDQVKALVADGEWEPLPALLSDCHPADLAEIISDLEAEDQRRLFGLVADELKPDVLAELGGCEPVYHWEGASIPIIPALAEAAGAAPLLVGFGHEDDHVHAPNESYSVEQFRRGFEYAIHFLRTAPQANLARD